MTKGTLTNGTVEIKGNRNYEEMRDISFTPDGSQWGCHFSTSEWTFVPDEKPLPHPDNVVILRHGMYPIVGVHGDWYQMQYDGTMRKENEDCVRKALQYATAMYQSGRELKKEDYA